VAHNVESILNVLKRHDFRNILAKKWVFFKLLQPNFATPAERCFKVEKIFFFLLQNALGYSWRCKFLQRWRSDLRSWLIETIKAWPRSQSYDFGICKYIPTNKRYSRLERFSL
jgi:hypothetical protein